MAIPIFLQCKYNVKLTFDQDQKRHEVESPQLSLFPLLSWLWQLVLGRQLFPRQLLRRSSWQLCSACWSENRSQSCRSLEGRVDFNHGSRRSFYAIIRVACHCSKYTSFNSAILRTWCWCKNNDDPASPHILCNLCWCEDKGIPGICDLSSSLPGVDLRIKEPLVSVASHPLYLVLMWG
jgi:hypothetical protein